jgi:glycosyltransferase involved in cell wall biosynthesis
MNNLAVLITIYNDQDGLETALESIREEDNTFTVVVVDGASVPPTNIDFDQYPFKIVLIRQEERSGIIGGLNAGLDYIRKEGFLYMARLDAGDLHRRERLGIQYRRLRDSKDLAMVGSNALYRSEETGEELFVTNLPLRSKAIRKWSVFRTCFIHPTVMIRLDRIDDSLRYESRYLHIEDYVLFTKIAERYETENLEEPLVDCFVREKGISRSNDRAQLLSGLRHHLQHPKPLKPLWHAYIFKRAIYLIVPFSIRSAIKSRLGFVTRPTIRNHSAMAPKTKTAGATRS